VYRWRFQRLVGILDRLGSRNLVGDITAAIKASMRREQIGSRGIGSLGGRKLGLEGARADERADVSRFLAWALVISVWILVTRSLAFVRLSCWVVSHFAHSVGFCKSPSCILSLLAPASC